MRTGEMSDILGVDKGTLRNWTQRFGEFLSPEARGEGVSQAIISEQDALVYNSIKSLRDNDQDWDTIRIRLAEGWRDHEFPENAVAKDTRTIPMPQAKQAGELAAVQRANEMLSSENERLRDELQRKEAEIQRLNTEWRKSDAELARENGKLQAQIEELRRRLGE